jgi:hypothetical protein
MSYLHVKKLWGSSKFEIIPAKHREGLKLVIRSSGDTFIGVRGRDSSP